MKNLNTIFFVTCFVIGFLFMPSFIKGLIGS
jgi:hypothetical protein